MNMKIEEAVMLDTDHLAKYTLGNHELEREVLHMFIDQTEKYLQRLLNSANEKDWFEASHSLKGSARGIGAFRVGMRAEQLEKTEEPLKNSVRCAILVLLQEDIEKTKKAISSHLSDTAPVVFV